MAWKVSFEPRAAKELAKLAQQAQQRIVRFLQERITGDHDPRDLGKPLIGDKAKLWRYRVGSYRIVCRIEDERLMVLVVRVGHRKDIYR